MGHVSARLRSMVRTMGVVACLVALVAVGTPAQAAEPARVIEPKVFGMQVWGWVVARQPSTTDYTPSAKDRGNSKGHTNTVHRDQRGDYTVTFKGLGTANGALVHISPLGTAPRLCVIDDWGQSGSDYVVLVDCRDRLGHRVDSAFVVNLLVLFSPVDDLGYVIANEPGTADYAPSVQYNSSDALDTVHRLGTGRWQVTLPGIGGSHGRGNVQVTAGGVEGSVCRVTSWTAGLVATVACRDHHGSLLDTSFDLTFMKDRGLKFEGSSHVAYVLADRPTTASYTPSTGFGFSSAGIKPRVARSARGVYSVKLDGMPLGGSAQVTAYGSGSRRCVVASIRRSSKPQRIGVRCFTADGSSLADAKFTLTYAH